MAKKRNLKTSIFIACEGQNTEPLYFEKIKENSEEDPSYPYAITIYPNKEIDSNPKTDAIGLVNVAIERKDDFSEVWVVFDKDGYTKHQEAFQLAEDNNVNIAFSSISFETWILLHFERDKYPYAKSADIITSKFTSNQTYLPTYCKAGEFNVMPLIEKNLLIAFQNASWLRNQTYVAGSPIYSAHPYTDVDILVKKLLLYHPTHLCANIASPIIFKDVSISAVLIGTTINLRVENNTSGRMVTNSLKIFDSNRNPIQVNNSIIDIGTPLDIPLFENQTESTIYVHYDELILEIYCII